MKNVHYAWIAMEKGELQSGMYTVSDAAATVDVARQVARPVRKSADAYALCEIATEGERMIHRTIVEIEPVDAPPAVPAKKWNVQIGDRREAISADILVLLGFEGPYANDESNTARDRDSPFDPMGATRRLAEAFGHGLRGDAAALFAVRLQNERRTANQIEIDRKKIAELDAKAAADHRAAEGMALARQRNEKYAG